VLKLYKEAKVPANQSAKYNKNIRAFKNERVKYTTDELNEVGRLCYAYRREFKIKYFSNYYNSKVFEIAARPLIAQKEKEL